MNGISDVAARNNLFVLLDEVERGRELVITRDGKPIAVLLAPADERLSETPGERAVDNLNALRSGLEACGALLFLDEIGAFRDEGRR